KPRDHRSHRDFGRARGAIVAFERDADAVLWERAAEHALGAGLHQHARAEPLHDLGAEAPGSCDKIRLRGAGGADARGGAGALLFQTAPAAEAREGERQAIQWNAPRRNRAAVDATDIFVQPDAGEAFERRAHLALHDMLRLHVAAVIDAGRTCDAEKTRMLARAVVVQP